MGTKKHIQTWEQVEGWPFHAEAFNIQDTRSFIKRWFLRNVNVALLRYHSAADRKYMKSTYNRASDVCMCVCVYVSHVLDRKLLERLMSPSPKSQVMFASAFS